MRQRCDESDDRLLPLLLVAYGWGTLPYRSNGGKGLYDGKMGGFARCSRCVDDCEPLTEWYSTMGDEI